MHLDEGRVQFDGLDLEAHDLLPLQLFKDAIQYAVLGPAIHAGVEGVPVAKTLRQPAPLAPLLGYIQQRVEHLQVGKTDIASLAWKAWFDTKILRLGDFHEPKHATKFYLVLTSPSKSAAEVPGQSEASGRSGPSASPTRSGQSSRWDLQIKGQLSAESLSDAPLYFMAVLQLSYLTAL